MKTMMISILCLLAFITQAVEATDPAEKLSTTIPVNREEILRATNICRKNVNPPATNMVEVQWNTEAQATASKYAKGCIEQHSTESQRQLPSGYDCGENLFYSSLGATWTQAINAFCNESKNFVYNEGPNPKGSVTGHYTQLVWYRSYMMGCEVAYCPNAQYPLFFVCHQCPPGNIVGKINTPYTKGTTCAACPGKCNNGFCTNPCKYNTEASNCADYKSYCATQQTVKDGCPGTCGCNNDVSLVIRQASSVQNGSI